MEFNKADFVARIATANGVGLTIITYEIAIAYIQQAIENHPENIDDFQRCIKKAQPAILSLIDTLDMQYDISKDLIDLYIYVDKLLLDAYFAEKPEPLTEALNMLQNLLEGWLFAEKAQKNDVDFKEDSALMENTQQIFAGLTYKNGSLEEYVKEDYNRGFKA